MSGDLLQSASGVTQPKKRRRIAPNQVRGTVRIIDPLASKVLCENLVSLVKKETNLIVRPVEAMEWQFDSWRCGYFSLYALGFATKAQNLDLNVQVQKMPHDFEKVVWQLLKGIRHGIRISDEVKAKNFVEPP